MTGAELALLARIDDRELRLLADHRLERVRRDLPHHLRNDQRFAVGAMKLRLYGTAAPVAGS